MRKLYALLSLSLVLSFTVACGKTGTAPANANAANAAKPANTNAAPATNTSATNGAAKSVSTSDEGELFTHEEGGLSFVVPKGWKFTPEGDQGVISTPDDALAIFVMVSDEGSLDAAVKALDEEISKNIQNMKITNEAREQEVNGMPGISIGGTGTTGGEAVEWSVDIIQAKKPVIFLSVANEEGNKKHAEDFGKFAKSIKKL